MSEDGDRFSPSMIRLTFYRDQPFIRVHHTFVIPDAVEMAKLFEKPMLPFVSGKWNVSTGVMGKHAAPDEYDRRLNDVTDRMIDELHHVVEENGWYGLLIYGNYRYGWDKTTTRWMKYNPKWAWFHGGHVMSGGALTQVLWNQYCLHRGGDGISG